MMDTTQAPASNTMPHFTKVPIAQLSPTLEEQEEKGINAAVTLVWPYSSSTKSLSLLLAEPDFRLRRLHGQVKAIFHGRVAEEVAGSQLGIGDTVRLSLKGANFVANEFATQTPGRHVAWDVHFNNGLALEIDRSSNTQSTVIVPEIPEPREPELLPPATPRVSSTNPQTVESFDQATWKSPAFMRSSPNNFGGLLGSQFDPFAEDDGFVPGRGRKRPRYSFQRADWRILDEPISPQDSEDKNSWESESWENTAEDDQAEQIEQEPEPITNARSDVDAPLSDALGDEQSRNPQDSPEEESHVFVKPSLELTSSMFGRRAPESNMITQHRTTITQDVLGTVSHLPTDTPQLRPIPSPGLPIPSPIVSGQSNGQGYFSEFHTVSQTQSPQSVPPELPPRGEISSFRFSSQGSLVHDQQPAVEDGANGAPMHPHEGTIPNTSDLGVNHLPETLSSEPSFGATAMPFGRPEDLKTPHLADEHAEPTVQNVFEDQTELMSAGADYNFVANEQDIEGHVGGDADEGADGQDGAQDENANHEGMTESEIAGDEVLYDNFHEEEYLRPELAADAQTAIDVGTVESQDGHALEALSSRDDSSETSSIHDNCGPHLPLRESNDESGATDEEAIDDVDDSASDYSSQYDYDDEDEGEVQAEESSEDESESAPLPPPQPSQPDIIILDSDSEDELASEQPAPPRSVLQHNVRDNYSFMVAERTDLETEDSGDDGPLSEPGTPGQAESSRQQDRVDDSDLEKFDSSVDVLASGHAPDQRLMRESPFEEENFDRVDDATAVSEGQDVDSDIARKTNPHLIIGVELGDDESRWGAGISQHLDRAVASSHEQDMPPIIRRIGSALDGASDEDQPPQLQDSNSEDQAATVHGNLNLDHGSAIGTKTLETSDQMAHGPSAINTELGLVKAIESQLPTPDLTQEVVDEQPSALQEPVFSVHPDSQTTSLSLSIPLDSSRDAPSDQTMLAPNDTVHEFASNDDVENVQHDTATWPATEATENETASPRTRGKTSEATAVLVSNPPAPNRQAHGLRSKYAYFAPLGTVVDHYNALVDTISIVNETSPISRAVSGSKDYYLTIQLSDPSMAGTLLQAQIFRRYKSALPSLTEGDAILLRDFKVRSYDHTMMLVSVDSSSWAVFDGSSHDAQVNGPPVEYGPEERAYASGLRRWYSEIGADTVADYQMQAMIEKDNMDRESSPGSIMGSDVGSVDSSLRGDMTPSARGLRKPRRRSHRRVTIHELRDGRRYTEVGSPSSKESIHELRDGTVYANL